jgi:predicted ABC-type sugar transport system permease subunit
MCVVAEEGAICSASAISFTPDVHWLRQPGDRLRTLGDRPVVVGGTLISGGEGLVFGTFVGVLLPGFFLNILNFLSGVGITLSPFWQDVVRGAFLLVVILLQNRLANKKLERM